MKYVFSECGCIREDFINVKNPHGGRFKVCPDHKTRLRAKQMVCSNPECGAVFETSPNCQNSMRCPECRLKRNREMMRTYECRKKRGTIKSPHREGVIPNSAPIMARKPVIKTDLKPNPIIFDPLRSPCTQGCQLARMGKDNTTCVFNCPYKFAYLEHIDMREVPEYVTV